MASGGGFRFSGRAEALQDRRQEEAKALQVHRLPFAFLLILLIFPGPGARADLSSPVLQWQAQFPWPIHWLVTSEGGVTLVGSDHGSTLQAHDALRGTRLWRRSLRAGLWSAPALRGNRLFLSPHDQSLLSLRVETGEFLWRLGPRFPEGSPRLPGVSPPLNRAAPVLLTEELATISLDGQVSVLSSSGTILRQADLQPGRFHPDGFWATPVALDGIMYLGTTRGNLWRVPLMALDRATRIVLEAPPERGLGQASLEVRAPLLATSNRILVATMDGTLRGYEPRPVRLVPSWTTTLGPPGVYQMSSQGRALAGPVLAPEGTRVYLALRDRVVALSPEDGHTIWERPLDEKAETPPACWRDTLLVGLQTSRLLVLDRSSGEPLSAWELPGPPTAGPEVWGDQVTLGFADGTIRCYDLSDSARASSNPAAIRIPR